MADEIMKEKVYCYNYPVAGHQDNSACWAMMANANNQWNNNPFAYMMIMAMMRFMYGDNWQNGMANNAEINARFNQLSSQMSDNHNTDIINEAVKGNSARLGELASNLNVDMRAIQSGICDLRSGIQQVAGETKYSAERVINAAQLGDTNIIMALKDCCCQNKELVQRMGYEAQLSQRDLAASLQAGHCDIKSSMQQGFAGLGFASERGVDRINSGLVQGFASVGFEAERNKCEIVTAINAAQQRTADLLNSHWKDEMSQALQDEKFRNSQLQQNIYMRDLIEKKSGCGCV